MFLLLISPGQVGFAQDALRSSLTGELAAGYRKAPEQLDYNIKAGPLSLLFDGTLRLDYVDNINVSEIDRQDDFIIQPRFDMRAYWPLTERNTLDFSMGVGYAKYLDYSENDTLVISPGSQLSFDVYVADIRLNFHDRFSYYQNPLDQPSISGGTNRVANYGVAANTIGLSADWDLNKLVLTAGYDYVINLATSSDFSYLDFSAHYFLLRSAFRISPTFTTGFEMSYGLTDYSEDSNSDNSQFSVGPYVDWQISPYMRLGARGGYVAYEFDPNATTTNSTDNSSFYGELSVTHQVNPYIAYTFSAGSQLQQGVNSTALEMYYGRHVIYWSMLRKTRITTELFYQHGKEFGPIQSTQAETFDRIGATLHVAYQLTKKLGTSLTYSFFQKNSNLPLRDYYQNNVSLDFRYRF